MEDKDNLTRNEIAGYLAMIAVVAVAWAASPWSRAVVGILLLGGVPLVFVLVLPFWYLDSLRRGLIRRTRKAWSVELCGGELVAIHGTKMRRVSAGHIASARLASNGNWTESRLVEDALTLFDARYRRLMKIPKSAGGFEELLAGLASRRVRIERVEVEAPVFLD